MKKLIPVLLAVFMLLSCASESAQASPEVSGYLKDGLRYLPVNEGNSSLELTVFRGDYIVFELPESSGTRFLVPGLDIDTVLPRPVEETPYVKIKKSGDFSFTLGEQSGVLTVNELVSTSYTELTAVEAFDLIQSANPLILDVRTPAEFERGHIGGASLLPVQVLEQNLAQLEPYKDEVIFVYCQSGNRSTVASQILLDEGFTRLYNLRYGIGDWISKGLPIE